MPNTIPEQDERATAEHEKRRPPFGAPYVFVLAIVDAEDPRPAYRLNDHETIVGRGDAAGIDLADPKASKRHALLRVEGGVCTMQDLGSLNGTWVNGRRMRDGTAQRLRHLDEVEIGSTRLLLLTGTFKRPAPR